MTTIDVSKELNEATKSLRDSLSKLIEQRKSLEAKIYKIEAVIEAVESTNDLQRIRRVAYPATCEICKESFKAHTKDAKVCRKRKCKVEWGKMVRKKGVKLIPGDPLSAGTR